MIFKFRTTGFLFFTLCFFLSGCGEVINVLSNSEHKDPVDWIEGPLGGCIWCSDDIVRKEYILINFTGSDWCGWCIKLQDTVFSRAGELNKKFPNLCYHKVDFPKYKELDVHISEYNNKLEQLFEVRGFPSVFIMKTDDFIHKKYEYKRSVIGSYEDGFDGYTNKIKEAIESFD